MCQVCQVIRQRKWNWLLLSLSVCAGGYWRRVWWPSVIIGLTVPECSFVLPRWTKILLSRSHLSTYQGPIGAIIVFSKCYDCASWCWTLSPAFFSITRTISERVWKSFRATRNRMESAYLLPWNLKFVTFSRRCVLARCQSKVVIFKIAVRPTTPFFQLFPLTMKDLQFECVLLSLWMKSICFVNYSSNCSLSRDTLNAQLQIPRSSPNRLRGYSHTDFSIKSRHFPAVYMLPCNTKLGELFVLTSILVIASIQ